MQAQKEIYQRPKVDGVNTVHVQGLTGKTTSLRLDTLGKLLRGGKITHVHFSAGMDYLRIVENFYSANSGLARIAEEAPNAGGNTDPIRLYTKARCVYMPTQKPRNVSRCRASFDGISTPRAMAIDDKRRLMRVLSGIEAESLLALYALIIHPSCPSKRAESLSAYTRRRYGFWDRRYGDKVVQHLVGALDTLHKEYGERLDKAA